MRVMIIDDEEIARISLADDLRDDGYDVVDFARGEPALAHLGKHHADVVVSDLKLPGVNGLELLRGVRTTRPETDVIIMTGFGTIEDAVDAMRQGAYDFITKPFLSGDLNILLERLWRQRQIERENQVLRVAVAEASDAYADYVVASPVIEALMQEARRVAAARRTCFSRARPVRARTRLPGPSTHLSARGTEPFVKITCAAYAGALLESELFGYERGAYTGAEKGQPGRFEIAQGGSVYLDDVDDIPLTMQTRLLRVIEERVIERVGSTRLFPVDVRIIASTKQDLNELVRAGKFRPDLYYRLNVLNLRVPPLRERPEDIVPLIRSLLGVPLSPACVPVFRGSDFIADRLLLARKRPRASQPRRTMEASGTVRRDPGRRSPTEIRSFADSAGSTCTVCPRSFEEAVGVLEQRMLRDALKKALGNKARAAEILNLKPSTFRNKLAQYGLNGD